MTHEGGVLELGAQWLHGACHANPLVNLAARHNLLGPRLRVLEEDKERHFYTRDGRSEWSLPDLTPDAAGVGAAVDGAVPDAPGLRRPKRTGQRGRPVDGRLSVLVSGVLSRKLLSGQLPGSASGSRSAKGSKPASAKKWAVRYGVVTENTLLFFPDERRQ